jgi:thioredoxin reductase
MRTGPPRLAILGAGPAGIEAALLAAHFALPFTLYERGAVAQHLQLRGHARLLVPWGRCISPWGLATLCHNEPQADLPNETALLTAREFCQRYLLPLSQQPPLLGQLQLHTSVLRIGRSKQGFRLLLRDSQGGEQVHEADAVLDCTGVYGTPRYLGEGGIPAIGELAVRDQIAWGLEDILGERRALYQDRHILLLGAGLTAASNAIALAELAQQHPSTWVTWVTRSPATTPLKRQMQDPLRERDQILARANHLATRGEGNIEFRPGRILEAVHSKGADAGFCVTFRGENKPLEVDRILANVGYRRDTRLAEALEGDHRNYYVLGMKALNDSYMPWLLTEMLRETFSQLLGRKIELPKTKLA